MKQNEILRNPRVIVVQKLYAQELNKKSELTFPKHRYKKFIKGCCPRYFGKKRTNKRNYTTTSQ